MNLTTCQKNVKKYIDEVNLLAQSGVFVENSHACPNSCRSKEIVYSLVRLEQNSSFIWQEGKKETKGERLTN